VNEKTYGDFTCLFFFCEPHDNGEIWANVLWDLREAFRTDLVLGSEAAAIGEMHRIYVDALALSPPSPTMLDLREAMLQADLLRNPGASPGGSENHCRIWTSLAGRGLGQNALDTQDTGDNTVVPNDEITAVCPQATRVTLTVTDAQAAEAGLDPGAITVTRTGDTSQDLSVFYTVGGTATAGADYVALPGMMVVPAGSSTATLPVIPVDDSAYEPQESVVVTLVADPAYVLGNVVSGTVTLVNDDAGPDLVVATLLAPAAAAAGSAIDVSDTTRNQGAGAASLSTTSFYLSTNAVFDGADVLLGARPVQALAPGASSASVTSLALPLTTAAGNYYVLARADAPGMVLETNETNNLRTDPIAVGPDLVVSVLSIPAIGGAGSVISVGDTTKNQGGGTAPPSSTRFYLSTNAVFDGTDLFLGARVVTELAAGASSAVSTFLTLPSTTPAGLHYILARADGDTGVPETNEERSQQPAHGLHLHRTRSRGERPHRSRIERSGLVDQRQRHHAQPGWRCFAALIDPLLPVHKRALRRRGRPHRSTIGPGFGGQRSKHGFHSARHPARDRRRQLLRPGTRRWHGTRVREERDQ
jgi:CARDB/Fungalysin metallopeptidase (M36)/Calx-beta domain